MSADVWIQNALLHVNYCSTNTDSFSVGPRLMFAFDFTQSTAPQGGHPPRQPITPASATLILGGFIVELKLISNGEYHIGQLVANEPLISLPAGVRMGFNLNLDLNNHHLREIEKLREAKDLQFLVNFAFTSEVQGNPQTRAIYRFQLRFKIPKSDWVEKLLPYLGLKSVSLIEIPKLAGSEFAEIIGHVDNAWKQYSMGEYHRVLTDCRKALESLTTTVKKKGFKKTTKTEERRRVLPDWGKLLGNDELGSVVGIINRKIRAFITPAAHAGRTINREDADFALMVTHALINLVTRKLVEMS
jgi:hypothetical protein